MSVLLHLSCCVLLMQDCVATTPPYPHYVGYHDDGYNVAAALSDPDSMWIVRPQLFFSCTVCQLTARVDSYNNSPDDIPLDLVFSVPLKIFTCNSLALWSLTESESFTGPPQFLPSTLDWLRTFLAGFHSFHASLMAIHLHNSIQVLCSTGTRLRIRLC